MRTLIAVLVLVLGLSAQIAAAQLVEAGAVATTTAETGNTVGVIARIGGEKLYAFGSWARHDIVKQTQSFSSSDTYAIGAGYRQLFAGITLFAEAGVSAMEHDGKPIVQKEAIYYTFAPIFGHPSFSDGDHSKLQHEYKTHVAPVFRIGAQVQVLDNLALEVAYKLQRNRERFTIWNDQVNGGPTDRPEECGCLWTGEGHVDSSGFQFGLVYKF